VVSLGDNDRAIVRRAGWWLANAALACEFGLVGPAAVRRLPTPLVAAAISCPMAC